MLSIIAESAQRGGFNAPFALFFSPWLVFVGWSAFRNAQGTCDRMASAFGAATSSETDRSRACYVTFRAAGVFFIIVGIGLFCVAAWHLLAT